MSSDIDDDQVLPDSLQKLEIVSVYPHSLAACKTTNDRNQNPFLTELSTTNSVDDRVRTQNARKFCFKASTTNPKQRNYIYDLISLISDNERPVWTVMQQLQKCRQTV